ncbi:AraC family transcriptional regulator [Paenibacillus sepulcri]|uniref:AraC family transcriptional regulator n=1 Tax=Paenibacillus sepulcri TaxID=359917 RepID=A0ABS7CDR1_9BACL|nr:AraC family transcriptional regulator [Paenibacillus sepulcri]
MENLFSLFNPKWALEEYRPQILAYYYKQWIDFHMGFHAHQTIEIMYVISGTCTVVARDQTIAMRKGDLIMLDSGVEHRLSVDGNPCRMLNVEFVFAECGGSYPSLGQLAAGSPALRQLLDRGEPYIVLRDPSDVYHTLKNLVTELDTGSGEHTMMANLLISQLLIRVARLAAEDRKGNSVRQIDRYVRKAADYIHQHYDADIQTRDIAAAVNLHPVYLQRIFKASMSMTMTEYLSELRIEKAKMLLARTDVPIIEIADYIGLNSRQYFSAMFKKHTGLSPATYRKSRETVHGFDNQVAIVDIR